MDARIQVLIVGQDRLLAEAVAASLANRGDLRVTAFTGDGEPAAAPGVDVLLLDAALDPAAALVRAWRLRERFAGAKMLVLGLEREGDEVVDFIEAGADGYVLKGISPDGLVESIRAAHDGRALCSPRLAARVLARVVRLAGEQQPAGAAAGVEPLTPREREVLAGLAAGLRNKEIAQRLHITLQTVKNHVHSILEKLGVRHRREAVRRAYEKGLLAEPGDTLR
jgi:DNA-binding NarL/FixJ family response regulator